MKKLRKKDIPKVALLAHFGLVTTPQPPAPEQPKLIIQRPFPKARTERTTVRYAREHGLCIYCRLVPAHYYGPEIGFGAGCDSCAERRRK